MAESNFNSAMEYVDKYLTAKEAWLDGSKKALWFTSGIPALSGLIAVFDNSFEDGEAYRVYEEIKKPDSRLPADKEAKHRLRLLFLTAATVAVRKQYMAGLENTYRTQNDTFRYEMANARAVRGCMKKFQRITEKMGEQP